MTTLPPLNALRAFEVAARYGSFKRAANELCVTQGAVSRHVQRLEAALGLRLFVRHHRLVELTPAGEAYCDEVRSAFQQIERATTALIGFRDDATLRVRIPPTCAVRWFVPRLNRFRVLYPDVPVQVTTSHAATDFDRERVDVAIQYGRSTDRRMACELLFSEELVPICTPEFANQGRGINGPEDLAGRVLLKSVHRLDDWFRWFTAAGISNTVMQDRDLVLENASLTYEGAEKGLGIALAQRAFVVDELLTGRLIMPVARSLLSDTGYYLVFPAERIRLTKVRAFQDRLRTEMSVQQEAFPDIR